MVDWFSEVFRVGATGAIALGGGAGIAVAVLKYTGGVFADQIAAATRQRHALELEELRTKYTFELERVRASIAAERALADARVDTAVYRSKAQFDLEFSLLKTVWAAVSEVRRRFTDVRPMMSPAVQGESYEDGLIRRANVLSRALNDLMVAAHDNEPFYPQEIFELVQSLVGLCKREMIDIEMVETRHRDQEWWTRAQDHSRQAQELAANVAEQIRRHLRNVVIVE
jgi:hypothetical protein